MKKWAYLFIVLGAALWGLVGIFVQNLIYYGFSPLQVVAIRVLMAGAILFFYVMIKKPSALKIKPGDIKYFIGTGILSITFFNLCYFTAIKELSLSVAVVLLYTAPAFVTIISRFVFKELLTSRKILALLIMLVGCSLVVGLLPELKVSLSWEGLIIGLGSGFGYALYSIFGKLASLRYSSLTITTYTFLFASIILIPIGGLWETKELFLEKNVWLYSLGLGLIPTILAYVLYTIGLSYVESSRASIIATIEPVVATLIGITFFGDVLTAWQFIGIIFVLTAIILVQAGKKEKGTNSVNRGYSYCHKEKKDL